MEDHLQLGRVHLKKRRKKKRMIIAIMMSHSINLDQTSVRQTMNAMVKEHAQSIFGDKEHPIAQIKKESQKDRRENLKVAGMDGLRWMIVRVLVCHAM
jgi:hypothetical protein